MALTEKSKNLVLNGTRLSAEIQKADGTWTTPHRVTIDLNDKLKNEDGNFGLGGSGFSGSAQNIRLVGTKLHARLTKRDRQTNEATLDLAFALSIVNGAFFFSQAKYVHMMSIENGDVELKEFIREFKANSRNLLLDGTRLSGEIMKGGRWTGQDTVDLQFKLGNNDGRFQVNGTNFAATARGIRVEGNTLRAELTTSRHQRPEAFVELAALLKVVDGFFFFRSEYENRSIISPRAESLADNSRNLRLADGHVLSGQIRKDDTWVNDTFDLAPKLGNRDGKFDFTGGANFHQTATEVRLEGATLRAYLKARAGAHYEDYINLAIILKVVDGKFVFVEREPRPLPSDCKFDEGRGLVARSRNLYVRGGMLFGETKKSDNSWTTNHIDLGRHIGNDRGRFNLDQKRFTWSASEFKLEGTTLLASLNNGSSWPTEAALDLALVVSVDEGGRFTFINEHQRKRIVSSVFFMFAEKVGEKVELHGLCLNKYGKLEPSSIDLNNYYKIDGSSFVSDNYNEGSRNLAKTARTFELEVTRAEVSLVATLRNNSVAKVNLNINIENRDGRFHFEKHDSIFGRDGAGTMFLEGLPVIGYLVALVHLYEGRQVGRLRVFGSTTLRAFNSNSCRNGLNGLPLWPPTPQLSSLESLLARTLEAHLGAALGAGIATPIGIAVETAIKKGIAEDVAIQFEEATVGRYIYETLRNMLAARASANFGKWVLDYSPGSEPLVTFS